MRRCKECGKPSGNSRRCKTCQQIKVHAAVLLNPDDSWGDSPTLPIHDWETIATHLPEGSILLDKEKKEKLILKNGRFERINKDGN